ncbi:MAG: hypothetical protein MZV63_33860 [Marinilabiliales bacterium]|nr:hypothetical protein [Marinilabiliales bacterium]
MRNLHGQLAPDPHEHAPRLGRRTPSRSREPTPQPCARSDRGASPPRTARAKAGWLAGRPGTAAG